MTVTALRYLATILGSIVTIGAALRYFYQPVVRARVQLSQTLHRFDITTHRLELLNEQLMTLSGSVAKYAVARDTQILELTNRINDTAELVTDMEADIRRHTRQIKELSHAQ